MSVMPVKLDEKTKKRLKSLGGKMDRSMHWLMKTAIEEYIDEQERYWREREEDMAEWKHYRLTGEGVSNKDVGAWLDSIGTPEETKFPE